MKPRAAFHGWMRRAARTGLRRWGALAVLFMGLMWGGGARADAAATASGRVPPWGRSLAGTDDSTAMAHNPANLAFMPGPELRWSSILVKGIPRGNALAFATPLLWGLASGLRADLFASDAWSLTWALALDTDHGSLGLSIARSFQPRDDGFNLYGLAFTTRPSQALSFSVAAHSTTDPTTDLGFGSHPHLNTGVAWLPTASRELEFGAEVLLLLNPKRSSNDLEAHIVPRLTAGVGLGKGFKLLGSFTISAGFGGILGASYSPSFRKGSAEVALGSLTVGPIPYPLISFSEVALRGFQEGPTSETSEPHHSVAVRVRLRATSDARGHARRLRQLWLLAEAPGVDAVVLELGPGAVRSVAEAQELRDGLVHLRSRGQRALCHLESGSQLEVYVCAAADRVLFQPAARLRFSAWRDHAAHLPGLLVQHNIPADFIRIGFHQGPEREALREAARVDLLSQLELQVAQGVASGRGMGSDAVHEALAPGSSAPTDVATAALIDAVASHDDAARYVSELTGKESLLTDEPPPAPKPRGFNARRSTTAVAIVHLSGELVLGDSASVPQLGALVGSRTLTEALQRAREDSRIAAVVLRIDSPGGSARAAETLWHEVSMTAKKKPLVVSMGDYAAGAGYYLATAAERVFASPGSITGGINVHYAKADIAALTSLLGLTAEPPSRFLPYGPEERRVRNRDVVRLYDAFLLRVAAARQLTKRQAHELAQGRVWTGEQALERRLVDELGGLRQAIGYVARRARLAEGAPLVELPAPAPTSQAHLKSGVRASAKLPRQHRSVARALSPFFIHEGGEPLMRLEQAPIRL